jgi:hypothetical protein
MTSLKSCALFLLIFCFSLTHAKTINIECDLKLTTSSEWAEQASDNQKELWVYDDQVGLKTNHVNYSLAECKLGEEELVGEKYTQDVDSKTVAHYQKTYLNRYNLLLKDYSEFEKQDKQFSSRMREGTCMLMN